MNRIFRSFLLSVVGILAGVFLIFFLPINSSVNAQLPTGSMPTVTGTPVGIVATVRLDQESQINVRSGPGREYPMIGVLLPGGSAPALGRSSGGDWILIEYLGVEGNQGWVYSPYISLTPGELPIIIPPPTPTPEITNTIDPTLAAQFIVTAFPTRLATYTESAPLVIPTYVEETSARGAAGFPYGLIIISFAGLGILVGLFSMLQTK